MSPAPRLKLATRPGFYLRALAHLAGARGDESSQLAEAERRIASAVGTRHVICTSLGRMAIYEGLRALLPEGGEVILSPITVPEVISMVLLAGATPVFCDVEPGSWNLDPRAAEKQIGPRTRAIMTTHFYGNMASARTVRRLCDERGLAMVEDAAQAVGVWQDGHHAGSVGDFGILSFSYPKGVTCFFGGALLTSDDALAARVREQIAGYAPVRAGWLHRRVASCLVKDAATSRLLFPLAFRGIKLAQAREVGWLKRQLEQELNPQRLEALPPDYRSRISGFQAGLLVRKWPEVDADVAHRIACARVYHERLADLPGVVAADFVADRSHGYLYYPIQVEDRRTLQSFLIGAGHDVALQHTPSCAELAAYRAYAADCPVARAACAGSLMLPTYPGYPLEAAARLADAIRRFFGAPVRG